MQLRPGRSPSFGDEALEVAEANVSHVQGEPTRLRRQDDSRQRRVLHDANAFADNLRHLGGITVERADARARTLRPNARRQHTQQPSVPQGGSGRTQRICPVQQEQPPFSSHSWPEALASQHFNGPRMARRTLAHAVRLTRTRSRREPNRRRIQRQQQVHVRPKGKAKGMRRPLVLSNLVGPR